MKTAIVRVRQNRCEQWNIDSSLKRGVSPFIGRELVTFEVIQGQAVIPVRQMAVWAAVARIAGAGGVDIFDATREYLSLWQYDRIAFFMDACNAPDTMRLAKACHEAGAEIAIVSGAKDIYRAHASEFLGADDAEWLGLDVSDACRWFGADPQSADFGDILPDWRATRIGDYCPYFVPVSLATYRNGEICARRASEIVGEIRELKLLGILTPQKKAVFDSPFASQPQAHEAILRLARRLVTEEITWAAYLPALTDGRDIALLRRAGLCMAMLGTSMSFHGLMHDGVRRDISRNSIEAFKSRGIIVAAELALAPRTIANPQAPLSVARGVVTLKQARRLIAAGIDKPEIVIDTPYPETRAFADCVAQNRIASFDWADYDGAHIVCRADAPADARAIEADYRAALRQLSSSFGLARRLFKPSCKLMQMVVKSALSFSESLALRFALAASARQNAKSAGASQIPGLACVTLVGKY